ncbi:hypothetical protein [Marinomonas pollencensis]|uniref:Uncharacterized protein n=1 Tax=Marinomonas pollencensis TaxID=491954 RepID=A0A3E0DJB8_9GAMM|nr:hypothetical protein [Marinomonas pollencensis]REG82193.1 hypothetical protein DFP81_11081 [Marinomonas pollencensis]
MFGLSRMRRQRELLYLKTQALEVRAAKSRGNARRSVLTNLVRPEGLLASFMLGLTTQCSILDKERARVLKMACDECIELCKAGFMTFAENNHKDAQGDLSETPDAQSGFSETKTTLSLDGNRMTL